MGQASLSREHEKNSVETLLSSHWNWAILFKDVLKQLKS